MEQPGRCWRRWRGFRGEWRAPVRYPAPGLGRNSIDIRYHVQHRRFARGDDQIQGALDLVGVLHPYRETAYGFG